MSTPPRINLTVDELVAVARDLRSETGENPEYDRALVELTADLIGETKELVQESILGDRPTAAQRAFDALSDNQKLVICKEAFEILEYDEDGKPGSRWSADTTQALGELFNRFGVTFTAI